MDEKDLLKNSSNHKQMFDIHLDYQKEFTKTYNDYKPMISTIKDSYRDPKTSTNDPLNLYKYKMSHRNLDIYKGNKGSSSKNINPSKTTKYKEGSPTNTKFMSDARKSLRLNVSQESRMKNHTLRKVTQIFYIQSMQKNIKRSLIIRRHK